MDKTIEILSSAEDEAIRRTRITTTGFLGRIFDVLNHATIGLIALFCLAPLVLVVIGSFSAEKSLERIGIWFVPLQWSTLPYQVIVQSGTIVRSYEISVGVTVIGTALSVLLMSAMAYALSNTRTRFRNHIAFYIYFTMLFSGGLLPWYLITTLVLGMHDNFAALIVPILFDPFWIFVLRNFFNTIPSALIESAYIDGADDLAILWRISMPLSAPALATVGLFTAVRYWNEWWLGTILIDQSDLRPLPVLIMSLINSIDGVRVAAQHGATVNYQVPTVGVQMATVVITIGPIVFLYPFLQKYFVRGLLIGGIKG
jgi:putative aldouronate transport system permease protein